MVLVQFQTFANCDERLSRFPQFVVKETESQKAVRVVAFDSRCDPQVAYCGHKITNLFTGLSPHFSQRHVPRNMVQYLSEDVSGFSRLAVFQQHLSCLDVMLHRIDERVKVTCLFIVGILKKENENSYCGNIVQSGDLQDVAPIPSPCVPRLIVPF